MSSPKPNLFIVGAPKCGTTEWVHYLKSHPDICFPDRKEPDYFNFDGNRAAGCRSRIIFLRDQYCLPSWHNQLLYGGGENIADFATAWRLSGKRDKSNMNEVCWSPKVLDYKAAGFFAEPIRRYISTFGRDQGTL
jgi:hypothetical protein